MDNDQGSELLRVMKYKAGKVVTIIILATLIKDTLESGGLHFFKLAYFKVKFTEFILLLHKCHGYDGCYCLNQCMTQNEFINAADGSVHFRDDEIQQ